MIGRRSSIMSSERTGDNTPDEALLSQLYLRLEEYGATNHATEYDVRGSLERFDAWLSGIRAIDRWGWVAADGTVYVRTAEGERVIGTGHADRPEEALTFFRRKYETLVGEVSLLERQVSAADLTPSQARTAIKRLQAAVTGAQAIGDLADLLVRLDTLARHFERDVTVTGSPTEFSVQVLTEDGWPRLRDIRLTALKSDPTAFLASYETELAYLESKWRREFSRGEWYVMGASGRDIGLVGATRWPDLPQHECDLEFLWVAPEFRRAAAATLLLRTVLDRLRDSGVRTIWLWLLNGNDPALRLFEQFGFQSTNQRQSLPDNPARSEERMSLRLS
jgi:ribosomal protein S18 acetylase RimI-like enzyme